MKDEGILKGYVKQFETSDRNNGGVFYGFRKMFWKYLTKLNVPFYDPCCAEASTGLVPGTQTLTGAGAVNTTQRSTLLVTTGANALTLGLGTEGQTKFIRMKTDGGDGTLTVTGGQG